MAAPAPESADVGDLLCLIVCQASTPSPACRADFWAHVQLDLNPLAWEMSAKCDPQDASGDSLSLQQALDHILIFCNAHLSLRHENQVAVFAAGFGQRYAGLDLVFLRLAHGFTLTLIPLEWQPPAVLFAAHAADSIDVRPARL